MEFFLPVYQTLESRLPLPDVDAAAIALDAPVVRDGERWNVRPPMLCQTSARRYYCGETSNANLRIGKIVYFVVLAQGTPWT